MKRTFEVTLNDAYDPDWLAAERLAAWLGEHLDHQNANLSVKDITPPEPRSDINATVLRVGTCPSCRQFVVPGTTCDDCLARQKEAKDIAREVVAEALEQMAKPFGDHMDEGLYSHAVDSERFAKEAKRLRALLEPTLTRDDCGKAARDDPPYANCPCSCPRHCAWAEAQKG